MKWLYNILRIYLIGGNGDDFCSHRNAHSVISSGHVRDLDGHEETYRYDARFFSNLSEMLVFYSTSLARGFTLSTFPSC